MTGVGPIGHNASGVNYRCIRRSAATVITRVTSAELGRRCDPAGAPSGACDAAIHAYCVGRGKRSGFGPVTASSGTFTLACLE